MASSSNKYGAKPSNPIPSQLRKGHIRRGKLVPHPDLGVPEGDYGTTVVRFQFGMRMETLAWESQQYQFTYVQK